MGCLACLGKETKLYLEEEEKTRRNEFSIQKLSCPSVGVKPAAFILSLLFPPAAPTTVQGNADVKLHVAHTLATQRPTTQTSLFARRQRSQQGTTDNYFHSFPRQLLLHRDCGLHVQAEHSRETA